MLNLDTQKAKLDKEGNKDTESCGKICWVYRKRNPWKRIQTEVEHVIQNIARMKWSFRTHCLTPGYQIEQFDLVLETKLRTPF